MILRIQKIPANIEQKAPIISLWPTGSLSSNGMYLGVVNTITAASTKGIATSIQADIRPSADKVLTLR
ncbi:hypothetical protein D3C85_1551280 [compost metagenome]